MDVMRVIKILKNRARDILSKKITFKDLREMESVYLYAGDVPQNKKYTKYIGLSLSQSNSKHIKFDILNKYPIPNDCVDIYQSEDVFEHIDIESMPSIIEEIYRILKPGGIFRLSLPDYRCDILHQRTQKNENGELQFDSYGGGKFINGKVVAGGHIWFPKYEVVKEIISKTSFNNVTFYHYYDEAGKAITNTIDYSIGHIMRTPDHDDRVKTPFRPMSIIVDCIK